MRFYLIGNANFMLKVRKQKYSCYKQNLTRKNDKKHKILKDILYFCSVFYRLLNKLKIYVKGHSY